jgi:hypothetical protein
MHVVLRLKFERVRAIQVSYFGRLVFRAGGIGGWLGCSGRKGVACSHFRLELATRSFYCGNCFRKRSNGIPSKAQFHGWHLLLHVSSFGHIVRVCRPASRLVDFVRSATHGGWVLCILFGNTINSTSFTCVDNIHIRRRRISI